MSEQYPISAFHFQVEWGGDRIGFTEVSGLNIEIEPIEYREGNAKDYNVTKMPGIRKFENITLKRGIYRSDNEFFQWLNTVKMNEIERRSITISLLNEEHEPVTVWKVKEAWPCKVEGPELNSTGNEVAVESIELCHEGLVIEFT